MLNSLLKESFGLLSRDLADCCVVKSRPISWICLRFYALAVLSYLGPNLATSLPKHSFNRLLTPAEILKMCAEENSGPNSVLEAIRKGLWDFEPEKVSEGRFQSTNALPGSKNKLEILAQRARAGLPLWHSSDRRYYEE